MSSEITFIRIPKPLKKRLLKQAGAHKRSGEKELETILEKVLTV